MKISFGNWFNLELDDSLLFPMVLLVGICGVTLALMMPMLHYDYLTKTNPNYKPDSVTIERNCN